MKKCAIEYTLDKCVSCLRCLKACPTDAITIQNRKVIINEEKCINCDHCVNACHNQGLKAKGSSLTSIKNYKKTLCLVPSSLICDLKNYDQVTSLFQAIKNLGFTYVYDLTDFEAQIYQQSITSSSNTKEIKIASFCPEVNKLIEVSYPVLKDNLINLKYPSEVAARYYREKLNQQDLGIYLLTECVSKLTLCKKFNSSFEVDETIALVDILPQIKRQKVTQSEDLNLCLLGLQTCSTKYLPLNEDVLIADGYDKINNILELAEFGLLNDFKLAILYPCFNGCLGGKLLWGNSYSNKQDLNNLIENHFKKAKTIEIDKLFYTDKKFTTNQKSMLEKMQEYELINQVFEQLPGYDCGACGFPSCRSMAEEIVLKRKTIHDCKIIHSMEVKNDN